MGIQVGPLIGSFGRPVSNAMAGVSQDATSLKYVPADATEWGITMTAAGIASGSPSNLWTCQVAAGSLTAQIGAVGLSVSGSPTYQNAVTGWTRKSVNMADGGASVGFTTSSIQNLSTTSGLLFAYIALTGTPAAERSLMGMGNSTDHRYAAVTTTPYIKAHGLAGATVTGTNAPGTTVHPVFLKVDRSRSHYRLYTDAEMLAPAWTNPGAGGSLLGLGTMIGSSGPAAYLYAGFFSGTAAELSDDQVRTLMTTLGWTVAW